jgi:hypothetical protein
MTSSGHHGPFGKNTGHGPRPFERFSKHFERPERALPREAPSADIPVANWAYEREPGCIQACADD